MSKISLIGTFVLLAGVLSMFKTLKTQTPTYTNKPLGYFGLACLAIGQALMVGGVEQ